VKERHDITLRNEGGDVQSLMTFDHLNKFKLIEQISPQSIVPH
jgi:hypothetical protein